MSYTLDTNLKAGFATTQYINFSVNSIVRFNHTTLCATSSGLYQHTDTESVVGYFEIVTDFGITNKKKIRFIQISFDSDSDLVVDVSTELDRSQTIVVPVSSSGRQTARVAVNRNIFGRFWTFQIGNMSNGCNFSIDEIKAMLVIMRHG